MNVYSRGFRNAFRNVTRSVCIIIILGLAIGLTLVMLIARQAVSNRISSVNSSIGNTITITPAGFNGFSSVNNSLTTSELSRVTGLKHLTSLNETLTDRLTTIGSSSPSFGGPASSSSSSTNQTSLTSPVKLNINRSSNSGGPSLFISGGGSFSPPTNFSLPISIIGSNQPTVINGSTLSFSSGQAISGSDTSNDAMVSSSMALKNSLKVGSTFTAYNETLTVKGIFTAPSTSALAGDIIVSLPTEQRLSAQDGDVTSAVATVDSLSNLKTATSAIKSTLGSSATVTSSLEQAANTTAPLNNVKTISLYSLIGAVIAGTVIIFLIMVMIARERRREIGVLKAIGASNFRVVIQFISEAITLTIAGSIIGIIIGVAASGPITHFLVNNESSSPTPSTSFMSRNGGGFGRIASGNGNFTLRESNRGAFSGIRNSFGNVQTVVGWSVVGYGIGVAVIIAVIGAGAASFLISRVRPAEVMRQE